MEAIVSIWIKFSVICSMSVLFFTYYALLHK